MRTSNKIFNMVESKTVQKIASTESIQTIRESKWDGVIDVEVAYFDENVSHIGSEQYKIMLEYYELLMSESPEFAPGKPANEYREIDLWYIIDKIKTSQEE